MWDLLLEGPSLLEGTILIHSDTSIIQYQCYVGENSSFEHYCKNRIFIRFFNILQLRFQIAILALKDPMFLLLLKE